ncbi:MAG TPA: hypothetical protein VHS31_13145 [Tepidisphaeraceae bacterium]|jgi:hypothetical protein|nr:hypothetical protein [Tepidisphaeraceae bacterium]
MSFSKVLLLAITIGLVSAFFAAGTCLAKDPPKEPSKDPSSSTDTPEVATLKQAYALLKSADHDYKGHRVKAMDSVKEACLVFGADPKGDGKGDQSQADSDTQLRQADQLLSKVRTYAAAQRQNQVLIHVNKAISEISLALARN